LELAGLGDLGPRGAADLVVGGRFRAAAGRGVAGQAVLALAGAAGQVGRGGDRAVGVRLVFAGVLLDGLFGADHLAVGIEGLLLGGDARQVQVGADVDPRLAGPDDALDHLAHGGGDALFDLALAPVRRRAGEPVLRARQGL